MGNNDSRLSRRDFVRGIGTAGAISASGLAGCSSLGVGDEPEPFTIAATVPKSGQYSDVGDAMERGYEFGASSENATATVGEFIDEEFNLIVRDDESDPDALAEELEDVASEYEVNMVWGSYGNELSQAGASFAESEEVPFLAPFFPYEEPHGSNEYEWTFAPSLKSTSIANSTANHIDEIPDEERPSRVGIWEPNSGWGTEMADEWERAFDEAEGSYDVVLREQFEPGTEDFADLVSQSMDEDVEVLLSNPTQAGGVAAIEGMKSENWSPSAIVFPRAADRAGWWSELGADGEYVMATPGWVPGLTTRGNTNLWSSLPDEYGMGDEELISTGTGGAYNATQVVMRAFQESDPYDADEVTDALRDNEVRTVISKFEFDDNGVPVDDQGFHGPIGQWYDNDQNDVDEGIDSQLFEAGPRRVFPRGDSYYGLLYQHPFPAWDER